MRSSIRTTAWLPAAPASRPFGRIDHMRHVLEQPRANDLADELGRRPDELIIEKTGASGFFGTDLVKTLIYHRVDTVIVTGAATSGCVRATVVDAASFNYFVIVPEDCVSDRAVASHQMSLFEMDQKYADVVPTEDVLRYLGRVPARPATDEPVRSSSR
jgi:nicotinamidase-related amidase